jgi:HK97 family phage major capsid protein
MNKKLKELREKMAADIAAMALITDTAKKEARDTFTDDETIQLDALEASIDATKVEIKDVEEKLAAAATRFDRVDALRQDAASVSRPAAARGNMVNAGGAGTPDRDFATFTDFITAVRRNPSDQRLASLWSDGTDARGEQRMDTGTSGGFTIPTQFIPTVMEAPDQANVLTSRATVIPAGDSPDAEVSMPALNQSDTNMRGGVVTAWTGEGATMTETAMAMKEIKLQAQELTAYVTLTDKLLRNWSAAATYIEGKLGSAVAKAKEQAFIRGNGVAKPLGILSAAAFLTVTRATGGTVKYADIAEMEGKFRGDSAFYMYSQSVLPKLMRLVDDDGRLIWQASAAVGSPATILGRPAYVSDFCSAAGTVGDLILVDASAYLIKEGAAPRVAFSEHVNFLSNKTAVKIVSSVDGQPWLSAALKGDDAASYSPFVGIAT